MQELTRLFLTAAGLWFSANAFGQAATVGEEVAVQESPTSAQHSVGTLIVKTQGLESSKGTLRFALFDSEENYLQHPIRAELVAISDRQGIWTIQDLPFGIYAVLVHHDVNSSGTMERRWYGKPKEPTGASNNAPARFGPPKFKKASIELAAPTMTITITVR